MTSRFLRNYSLLLIKTCHRREIHAMGGMAAQIPIRDDPAANQAAMERVRADKLREARDGHGHLGGPSGVSSPAPRSDAGHGLWLYRSTSEILD